MAIIGRGGRVWYSVVSIDDGCDACAARNVFGICFGPGLPVLCFDCLAGAVDVVDMWKRLEQPSDPPQRLPDTTSSETRR